MSPEEFIQMMNELSDDIIEAANTPPVRKNIKIRYIIPAAAACIVILIAAVIYPKLKTQTPAILPETAYTDETTVAPAQTDTQTAPEQTDASAVSETTHIRSESAVQTTGTTVRTSVTTATGTAQTSATVTTRVTAVGTAHTAETGTSRTTSRTRITQTTKQTAVTTRRTTARTTETRSTTTRRTTAQTTQTTPAQTTGFAEEECTTTWFDTTAVYSFETTRMHDSVSVPVFRSETEFYTPENHGGRGWPGAVKAKCTFLSDDELQYWRDTGVIPFDTDLSAYDLIRVYMDGEGQKAAVTGGTIQNGRLTLWVRYVTNPDEQRHSFGVRVTNIVAVPKEYNAPLLELSVSRSGMKGESEFENLLAAHPNDMIIEIY
ncbi:MAG TPA: hypothetical protein DCG49_10555 [Ruminococcus sp.]|nr:hypothetical protein [Ruminococcus sp.]